MTTLTRIADGLYAPDSGEPVAFLLADPAGAPDRLPLADTWSDDGAAQRIGTHVFLDVLPSGAAAQELASALRGVLPERPVTTGFAWALAPPQFALATAVAVALDGSGRPAVAADTPIRPRPPFKPAPPLLGLAAGLAVRASATPFAGWTLLTQPLQAEGAARSGIDLPLLGAASGDLSFEALLESRGDGRTTVKRLAAVRSDPLRPTDPRRTSITPLGAQYRLTTTPDGGHVLAPAGTSA